MDSIMMRELALCLSKSATATRFLSRLLSASWQQRTRHLFSEITLKWHGYCALRYPTVPLTSSILPPARYAGAALVQEKWKNNGSAAYDTGLKF